VSLYESPAGDGPLVVFAVTGDMVLLPVFEAKDRLEAAGSACASSRGQSAPAVSPG
jgi:phosphoketolase